MTATMKDALARLTELRDSIDPILSNIPIITALECAIAEIGKCANCKGTGKVRTDDNIGPGYQRILGPNGKHFYNYPCAACKGVGKILTSKCSSCDVIHDPTHEQKFPATHCMDCEQKLMRRGVLIC